MKAKTVRVAGIVLMLLGVLLPLMNVTIPGLTTVVIDTSPPSMLAGNCFPSSTDPNKPTAINKDNTIKCVATDSVSGVNRVTVTIEGSGYTTQTFTMSPTGSDTYTISWSVPSGCESSVFGFTFKAYDKAGNVASITTYGLLDTTLAADLYINDQKVSPTATIYIRAKPISFRIVVTKNAWLVVDAKLRFDKPDGTMYAMYDMSPSGPDYVTSVSPADGVYNVHVYLVNTKSQDVPVMSIVLSVGEETFGFDVSKFFNYLTIAGFVLVIVSYWKRLEA